MNSTLSWARLWESRGVATCVGVVIAPVVDSIDVRVTTIVRGYKRLESDKEVKRASCGRATETRSISTRECCDADSRKGAGGDADDDGDGFSGTRTLPEGANIR